MRGSGFKGELCGIERRSPHAGDTNPRPAFTFSRLASWQLSPARPPVADFYITVQSIYSKPAVVLNATGFGYRLANCTQRVRPNPRSAWATSTRPLRYVVLSEKWSTWKNHCWCTLQLYLTLKFTSQLNLLHKQQFGRKWQILPPKKETWSCLMLNYGKHKAN